MRRMDVILRLENVQCVCRMYSETKAGIKYAVNFNTEETLVRAPFSKIGFRIELGKSIGE